MSSISAWFNYFLSRFTRDEAQETSLAAQVAALKAIVISQGTALTSLQGKVNKMSDVLDTVKADFESYKGLVDSTLQGLKDKVASLLAGQLDPAKAQAIDDEINAAKAALNPTP